MTADRELIQAVIDGDREAADHFVARFTRFVWAILVRSLRVPADLTDEIYQEVFVRLWDDDYRRLRNWSGDGDFAPYLAPIVRNLALDRLRAAGRHPRAESPEPQPLEDPVDAEPSPEELAMAREQRDLVQRAVERLGPRDRELYRRRFEQQQSYREIASAMDMTVNHVGVALNRLERRLANFVAQAGGPAPRRAVEVRSPGPGPSGS